MIGSSTLIVKTGDGKYHVHSFNSGLLSYYFKKISPDVQFKKMSNTVNRWKKKGLKPELENISKKESLLIANATNCDVKNKEKGYHKFAGDDVYLLNYKDSTFKFYDLKHKCWAFIS